MILNANERRLLTQTLELDRLVIAEGAGFDVPDGHCLTMTVDGRAVRPAAGEYSGKIVLSVNAGFKLSGGFGADNGPDDYRAALYIDADGVNDAISARSAIDGGSYDADAIRGVAIHADDDVFGGIVVRDHDCAIEDVSIAMNGYGGNDFTGKGTGIVIGGTSHASIDRLRIENRGTIRNAIIVTDDADVVIRDSDILVYGGDEAEQARIANDPRVRGGMTQIPWMLGLSGNNRATTVLERADALYENCRIRAENWGALSVDATDYPETLGDMTIHLTAKNCDVDVFGNSGYGAFSIGSCLTTYDSCRVRVPGYALIMANEYASGQFLRSSIRSDQYALMAYANQNGRLDVKDSVLATGMAAFTVKGCYPVINVERSVIDSKEGIILQLMDCDDPCYAVGGFELDREIPEKIPSHDIYHQNFHDYYLFNKLHVEHASTDAVARFADMTLAGDFYNGITNACPVGNYVPVDESAEPEPDANIEGNGADMENHSMIANPSTLYPVNLVLSFENVGYTGVISSSRTKHYIERSCGEKFYELGHVRNTPSPAVNNGVLVSFDAKSRWTLTGTCYLTSLTLADGARVDGEGGRAVAMTVNGVKTPLVPGEYVGDIVITLE